jgi:DNA-binding beta-propeller fold protein YncE
VQVPRTRRLIGLLSLLALVAIGVGLFGVELPTGSPGGSSRTDRPLAGAHAINSTLLVRVGNGAPSGGDLAFLAIEPSGNLIVSDRARHSVLRFDASGHLLSEWGPRLSGDLTLAEPAGVAVQGDAFYVLDRGTPRVIRLDETGRVRVALSLEQLGTYGLNGLAVDPAGTMYAADTGRNRILVLAPTGSLLRQIGRGGSGLGEFTQPMALAFLPDGGFVVADWENSRLERWDEGFNATDAWSIGFRAWGVAADADGRIYAPDLERRRVVVYSPRGDLLSELNGIEVGPRQVALSAAQPTALYVLGSEGIVRMELENTAAPLQSSGEVDLVSPIVLVLLLALPVAALLMRRGRLVTRSIAAAAGREIGLQAVDGAQGQQEQTGSDQDLVVAEQADGKDHTRDKYHQTVGDRQTDHRR